MTNYIEQLMKAAGVGKYKLFRQYNYAQVPHGEEELQKSKNLGIECVNVRNCKDEDNTCIYWYELHYPAFTPEKQLELEKLLMDKIGYIKIFHIPEIPAKMPESYTYNIFGGKFEFNSKNYIGETRPQALALLAIKAIEFNELDKSEVRRILEGDKNYS